MSLSLLVFYVTCDDISVILCEGTDVQADWRRSWSCTYGRAPNAIDISQGSLTGTNLFIRWFRHTAPLVTFYDTLGIRRTYSRLKPPAPSRGFFIFSCFCWNKYTYSILYCSKVIVNVYKFTTDGQRNRQGKFFKIKMRKLLWTYKRLNSPVYNSSVDFHQIQSI